MQNFYIYPLVCAIVLVIFGNFWGSISSQLYEPSVVELIPVTTEPIVPKQPAPDEQSEKSDKDQKTGTENLEISEKMERKRRILERGCSMIHSLYEMSQNGTSYEDLLKWHARIHDLRRVFNLMLSAQSVIG